MNTGGIIGLSIVLAVGLGGLCCFILNKRCRDKVTAQPPSRYSFVAVPMEPSQRVNALAASSDHSSDSLLDLKESKQAQP